MFELEQFESELGDLQKSLCDLRDSLWHGGNPKSDRRIRK